MALHEHPDPGLRLLMVRREHSLEHPWSGDLSAPFWRLYWPRTRGGFLKVGGTKMGLDPRGLLVIPPELSFHLACTGPIDLLFVHFALRPGWKSAGPATPRRFPLTPAARRVLTRVIARLEDGSGLAASSLDLSALLCAMLSTIPWQTSGPAGYDDGRMTQALEAMARYGTEEGFTLSRWASLCSMGTATLHRLFRFHFSTSPRRHLLAFRLSLAEAMLVEGQAPIESVAADCGFADRFHFTRHFRKRHGMGPGAYRKMRWQLRKP